MKVEAETLVVTTDAESPEEHALNPDELWRMSPEEEREADDPARRIIRGEE